MQIGVDTQHAVESKRVFIIDSDDVSAMALQFILADELEAHVLEGSTAALAQATRGQPPDVLLLGTSVIEAEGTEVVARLLAALPGVPVIAFGPAAHPGVAEALRLGARSAIARPFMVETVRQRVNAQIGRRALLSIPVVLGGGR
jgi:DNA-binding NtrC family response regulator